MTRAEATRAVWAIAIILGLYGLHRLGLWMEERGWIYYRRKHGSSGTLADALLEVQAIMEPSKRYVLEERAKEDDEAQKSGDPAAPGKGGRCRPTTGPDEAGAGDGASQVVHVSGGSGESAPDPAGQAVAGNGNHRSRS